MLVLSYISGTCKARSLHFTNHKLRMRRQATTDTAHAASQPEIDIDSQSKGELRNLLENYQSSHGNVDQLISSILTELYTSDIEIRDNVRQQKGVWGPISISLEGYVLMERARRNGEETDVTPRYDDLISQWTQAG